MAVETDADLAAFFDEDAFAEAATWQLSGGGSESVSVIVNRGDRQASFGTAQIKRQGWKIMIRTSEIPDGAGQGDTLVLTTPVGGSKTLKLGRLIADETRAVTFFKGDPQ